MRVYSKSQGKVIETGETGQTGIGAVSGGQDQFQSAALMDLLTTGGKNLSKIKAVSEFFPEGKKSAQVQKRELILNQAAPVLNRITSSAMKAPAGWTGWYQAQTGKIPGVAGGEAEYLRRDVEGFARLIASAFASEVGVATDKDVARWKAIMPQPGDTYEERVRQSQKLIEQVEDEAASLGMKVPSDIIEAAKLLPTGSQAGQAGQATNLPLALTKFLFPHIADLPKQLTKPPTKTEPADILAEGAIAGAKLAPGVVMDIITGKALAKGAQGLYGLAKGGGPKGMVGTARKVAAGEAQKVSGGASTLKLAKKAETFLEAHPEAKTKANLRLIEGLTKTPRISVDDLLARTQVWNDAYAKAGGVKAGIKNKIYDILAKEGKREIARIAPEVAKKTAQLRLLYKVPKTLSRGTWQLGKIGAGAGGLGFLGRLLGIW